MVRTRSRRSIILAALPFLLALGAPPVSAATAPVRYTIDLGSSCLSGVGPKSKNLTIVLRSAGGAVLKSLTEKTDAQGRFDYCYSGGLVVTAGMKLVAKQGSTTLRTFTIPNLAVRATRDDDKVSGKAPAGKRVRVVAYDCHTDVTTCAKKVDRTLTASSKGAFSTDVTSVFDAKGGDELVVSYATAAGDRIRRDMDFPIVYWLVNLDMVSLRASAGSTVHGQRLDGPAGAELDAADIQMSASGSGTWNVIPDVGDRLTFDLASDAVIDVPAQSIIYDNSGHVVSGVCFENAPVLITATMLSSRYATTTDGSGAYSFDFDLAPGGAVNPAGGSVNVWCFTPAFDVLYSSIGAF